MNQSSSHLEEEKFFFDEEPVSQDILEEMKEQISTTLVANEYLATTLVSESNIAMPDV